MDTIAIPPAAAQQIQILLGAQRRAQENLELVVNTLGLALGVPEGWGLDLQRMAFVPPAGAQIVEVTPEQLAGAVVVE